MSYQREFERRVKVAFVGIGSHAYRNLLPVLNFLPVELKAVCNRSDREAAARTAAQYGCRAYQSTAEMYAKEDLEAVFFCVSAAAHPGLIAEALAAGLHCWAEKPLAMTSGEVEDLIGCRGDRVVLVGYKKAFMPGVTKAIEIVNSPKYGNLESMLAVYPLKLPADGARVLAERQTTDWLNNGCHPLSVLMAVGGRVNEVVSVTSARGSGACLLFFENGAVGTLQLASGPQPLEDYHFYAPKWHLQIDNTSRVILERGIPFVYGRTTSFVPEGDDSGALVWEAQNCKASLENMSFFIQGMYFEMMEFLNCILEGRKPEIGSLEFALELTKVYEGLLLSGGKPVTIRR